MDQLWAPWRLSYVSSPKMAAPSAEAADCFLCRGLAASDDKANLIVLRTPLSVVVLNKFPYNNGHLLVCPNRHAARLDELTADEVVDQQATIRRMCEILERRMSCDGFNVGVNLGRAAGAGLPGHLHWHIVPRWLGDTNFMPVLADAKVIVQSLDALYQMLTGELD